jgi:hypothetical protein
VVPTKVPFTNTDVPTRGSSVFASETVPETAANAEATNNDAINIVLRIRILSPWLVGFSILYFLYSAKKIPMF